MRRGIKEHFLEEVTPELKIRVSIRRQMWGMRGEGGSFQQRGCTHGQRAGGRNDSLCSKLPAV